MPVSSLPSKMHHEVPKENKNIKERRRLKSPYSIEEIPWPLQKIYRLFYFFVLRNKFIFWDDVNSIWHASHRLYKEVTRSLYIWWSSLSTRRGTVGNELNLCYSFGPLFSLKNYRHYTQSWGRSASIISITGSRLSPVLL